MKIRNISLTDTAYVYKLNNLIIPENSVVVVPSYFTELQVREAIAPFENLILLQSSIVTYNDLGIDSGSVISIDELPLSGSSVNDSIELEFDYSTFNDASILIGSIAAERDIENLKIIVNTAFDGGASVTVGDSLQPDRLAQSSNSELAYAGIYDIDYTYSYNTNTDINLYMNGTPTVGSGKVIIFLAN